MFPGLYLAFQLVLLTSQSVVIGGDSDNTSAYEGDISCVMMAKLVMNKLDKQAKDLEELKAAWIRTIESTGAISSQLRKHSSDLLLHDDRLKAHDSSRSDEKQFVQSIYGAELGPRDCTDIRQMGYNVTGIYRVYPGSDIRRIETNVYCDFRISTESWLVFQRRIDGTENFYRTWREYEHGFGVLDGEFWLGNEKLSLLTMNKKYKLRIEMEDFLGEKRWAEYSTFTVRPSTDKYRLTLAGYSGNAGDSFTYSNNMMFSTKDADNDPDAWHCAQVYPAGWWSKTCHHANLNALYLGGSHSQRYQGVCWFAWKGEYYSLKATEMKITAVI